MCIADTGQIWSFERSLALLLAGAMSMHALLDIINEAASMSGDYDTKRPVRFSQVGEGYLPADFFIKSAEIVQHVPLLATLAIWPIQIAKSYLGTD